MIRLKLPKYYLTLSILLSIFCYSTVNAQNVNDALRLGLPGLGSSARALGMGNSYLALSDDASAAYFNPAGFGLIKRLEISGGLNYNSFNNSTTFMRDVSSYSNSSTRLDRLSFAFPFPTIRGSLVFGLSYHTSKDFTHALKFSGFNNGSNSMIQDLLSTDVPYDLYLTDNDNNTPINGRLHQSGDVLSSGSINNWTFSGAIEISKNLYFGLNLSVISGAFERNRDYYEDDTQNIYQGETAAGEPQTDDFKTFYLNNLLNWNLSGWDAKIGLIYQINTYARFGATVQFPKTFYVKEKFMVDGSSEFGTGKVYNLDRDKYSDAVEYDIITPFSIGSGFSVNYKGFILSGEATFTDYTQLKFENPKALSAQYISGINKDIKDLLRPAVNLNVGLEYTIPVVDVRLRGGFFIKPSAYKDDPSDYDKKYVTAGIGFLTEETIGIDLGFAHGWWKDFGDNYGFDVSRTHQDITVNHLILGVTYRF